MHLTVIRAGVCLILGAALAACNTSSDKVVISPEAEAALPAGTDIRNVRRLSNGCYFVIEDRGLSGFSQPLVGPDGTQVCDPVLFEELMNQNRVVVNERAV